jgi:hypothetical protein
MWINLSRESVEKLAEFMEKFGYQDTADGLRSKVEDAFDEANGTYVELAKERHQSSGEVEIDEQPDGSAMISVGADGAYVLAWVFVPQDVIDTVLEPVGQNEAVGR